MRCGTGPGVWVVKEGFLEELASRLGLREKGRTGRSGGRQETEMLQA